MKYCIATKISTDEVYNNELRVDSLHVDFDSALAAAGKNQPVIEVADNINVGDSINDNGAVWRSAGE